MRSEIELCTENERKKLAILITVNKSDNNLFYNVIPSIAQTKIRTLSLELNKYIVTEQPIV